MTSRHSCDRRIPNCQCAEGVASVVALIVTFRGHRGIPTGLLVGGAEFASQSRLLEHLIPTLRDAGLGEVIPLEPGQLPNTQIALKTIIKATICQVSGEDAYQSLLDDRTVSYLQLA